MLRDISKEDTQRNIEGEFVQSIVVRQSVFGPHFPKNLIQDELLYLTAYGRGVIKERSNRIPLFNVV